MSRDDAILLDMLTAVRRAVAFASGLTHDQLGSDLKTQSAILHQLLVLGEAAKRLSDSSPFLGTVLNSPSPRAARHREWATEAPRHRELLMFSRCLSVSVV